MLIKKQKSKKIILHCALNWCLFKKNIYKSYTYTNKFSQFYIFRLTNKLKIIYLIPFFPHFFFFSLTLPPHTPNLKGLWWLKMERLKVSEGELGKRKGGEISTAGCWVFCCEICCSIFFIYFFLLVCVILGLFLSHSLLFPRLCNFLVLLISFFLFFSFFFIWVSCFVACRSTACYFSQIFLSMIFLCWMLQGRVLVLLRIFFCCNFFFLGKNVGT